MTDLIRSAAEFIRDMEIADETCWRKLLVSREEACGRYWIEHPRTLEETEAELGHLYRYTEHGRRRIEQCAKGRAA